MNKVLCILISLVVSGCGGGGGTSAPSPPVTSVLFIGDSLSVGRGGGESIGYSRAVEYLNPPFQVHRLDHNAQGTIYQLGLIQTGYMESVLESTQPEIVVINAMGWDIDHEPTTLEEYEYNLKLIFEYYSGYEIFFILAPYSNENEEWDTLVDERNQIAIEACLDCGVKMIDPRVWELGFYDDFHLDNESYFFIAEKLIDLLTN